MNSSWWIVHILALILIQGIQCCNAQGVSGIEPRFTVSENPVVSIAKDQEYIFGYLEVPENRNRPASGTISLPVYIFKSRSAHPQPDPIIYTVGGPGSSTMPSAQYMKYYQYLNQRDFILIEQRGTRYARPNLACPEWAAAVARTSVPGMDRESADRLLLKAASDCRKQLTRQGIDLDGYRTTEIAADIADLVKALGLKQYNLLTISYSTKIAQVLLREYPQGIRSVVMDSPLPLQVNYDELSVSNLMKALDRMFRDCESDPGCNSAFPRLKERFLKFLRERNTDPLLVEVPHPETGALEKFALEGEDLIGLFSNASTAAVPDIPFEINRLLNGDLSELRKKLAALLRDPGPGNGLGMRLSVWCAEELPFADPEVIDSETYAYPEVRGLSPAVFSREVCQIWNVEPAGPEENEAVGSEVPVLLISGAYDSETPPSWADLMRKDLPNSFHLVFPGWKHTPTTNWGNPCAMEAANQFFNDPNQQPGPPCLMELGNPEFRTD